MNNFLVRFAATYDCGAYGSSTYNSSGNCTTTTSGGQTSGSLIDTGMSIILPLALGVVLVISAIILMLRRKKKK